jgi:hypothetical protein
MADEDVGGAGAGDAGSAVAEAPRTGADLARAFEAAPDGEPEAVVDPTQVGRAGQAPAGVQAGAAAAGAGGVQAGWEAQALPPGHPGLQAGLRTWGDLNKRYQSSSHEVRHYQQQVQQQTELVAEYRQLIRAMDAELKKGPGAGIGQAVGGQGRPQQPGQGQQPIPGFDSLEQYSFEMKQNPGATLRKMIQAAVREDKGLGKEVLDPLVQERLQPLQMDAELRGVQAAGAQFFAEHPECRSAEHPVAIAMNQFMQSKGWLRDDPRTGEKGLVKAARMLQALGEDPFSYAFAKVAPQFQAVQAQQVKAAEAKLGEKRATAGTARPGTAGHGVPAKRTPGQGFGAVAADLQANGVEVDPKWAKMLESSYQSLVR